MRRVAALLAVSFAIAGCGGGGEKKSSPETQLKEVVKEKTDKVRERVKKQGKEADVVDKALLEIEQSDLPDDVKKELLEAKELLDKQSE